VAVNHACARRDASRGPIAGTRGGNEHRDLFLVYVTLLRPIPLPALDRLFVLSKQRGGHVSEFSPSEAHLVCESTRDIAVIPHLSRIYIVLRYERRPMYLMVSAYAPVDGAWRVTGINWNRDPDKVFPLTILDPEMPRR
jgi:hypothetical protein